MPVHEGVTCDVCRRVNFEGLRFKCEVCTDYDLCGSCYEKGAVSLHHSRSHQVKCIPPWAVNTAAGVQGTVKQLSGNFMPEILHVLPDGSLSQPTHHHFINPHINVFVIALRAPISREELDSHSSSLESIQSHPNFIKMTQTDSQGRYQFNLPAGIEATIVAWINNRPYLRQWAPITVPSSGYVTFDIEDNTHAVC